MYQRRHCLRVALFVTMVACLALPGQARKINQPHPWANTTYIENHDAYQYVVNLLPPENEAVSEPPYTVTAQAKYCAAAQEMMRRVYEMTESQHRIFRVHFYHHSGDLPGIRQVDWYRSSGTAHVSTWGGNPSGPIQMYDGLLGCKSTFEAQNGMVVKTGTECADQQYTCVDDENSLLGRMVCFDGNEPVERPGADWGWTLAHEAGHWFYTMSDEYVTSGDISGFPVCVGDDDNSGTDQTSLMASRSRNHACDDVTHVDPRDFDGVLVDNPESQSAWDLADDFWPDLGAHVPGMYLNIGVDGLPAVQCVFHQQALNDTLLVLDRSGSMDYQEGGQGPTALDQAVEASLGFYNTSTPGRAAGVLGFNENTQTLIDYAPFNGQIVDDIGILPNGNTDICEAITTAADMIQAENPTQAHGVAVLLSDGSPTTNDCDTDEEVLDAAWEACHGGAYPVSIWTLAFGDADEELLHDIATVCAGEMVVSGVQFSQTLPTPHELKIDITRTAYQTREQTMLMDVFEPFNEIVETNTFSVPAGSEELEVVWLGDGSAGCDLSALTFELLAPDSTAHDGALESPVGPIELQYHTRTIRVANPQPGQWTARVEEPGPSFQCFPAGVDFGWLAHVKHKRLEANVEADPPVGPRNGSVKLGAYLQFPMGHLSTQMQASGTVYHNGLQWSVVLNDDGVDPDDVADDGYYSGTFNPDGFLLQEGGYRAVIGLTAAEGTATAVEHPAGVPGEVISPTAPDRLSADVLVETTFVLRPCCDSSIPPATPSETCSAPEACVDPSLTPQFGTLTAGQSYPGLSATLTGNPIGSSGASLALGPGIDVTNASARPNPTGGGSLITFDADVGLAATEGFHTLSLRYGSFVTHTDRAFQVTATAAGAVPSTPAGPQQPLLLSKQLGGTVGLDWGPSCNPTDVDYEVYEGQISDYTTHQPIACSTGGATNIGVPEAGPSAYYLVVPASPNREGSYGVDSAGMPRPASSDACLVQSTMACGGVSR